MSTTFVHQLVPSVVPGDATTGHTLQVQRLLRDLGYESEIFALAIHPLLEHRARLIEELRGPSRRDRFLVYQCSAVSELGDWVVGRRESVAVDYHNITPPEFFHRFDPGIALSLHAAQVQVAQLSVRAALGICDSRFNAADLRARGFRATPVAPILLDLREFDAEPDPATAVALEHARREGSSQWLFVGGIAPHKAQHRLVQALAVYRSVYDPGARLSLVGRAVSPGYDAALRTLVGALGLDGAVDLPGAVSHEQLVAYYRAADVFVSLSEHEGFCVPLLEAMHHGVPVVALGAGAVPETLGVGGLLLDDPAPQHVAAALHRVLADRATRAVLVEAGRARLVHFALARTRATMAGVVRRWVAAGGVWPDAAPRDGTDDVADDALVAVTV
ncbi:MAG TPA: glycosyltransferase [Acidimicrobiales bacterium]|nr:glycosyltransferase [Acidimicrobiales bacterium]